MKRTNIVLDESLIDEAMRLTGLKTQHAVINFALQELVRRENSSGFCSSRES